MLHSITINQNTVPQVHWGEPDIWLGQVSYMWVWIIIPCYWVGTVVQGIMKWNKESLFSYNIYYIIVYVHIYSLVDIITEIKNNYWCW